MGFFIFLLQNPTKELIQHIDRIACHCNYTYHWYYNMNQGTWNPNLNELDYELRDVKTPQQLYTFLINKHNDLQVHSDMP